jgi:hypothetical protein
MARRIALLISLTLLGLSLGRGHCSFVWENAPAGFAPSFFESPAPRCHDRAVARQIQ